MFVNVRANRITNFLKQDLFGGLRSDAAKFFHRHRQQQRISYFNFIAAQFACFINRQFSRSISNLFDDDFRRGQLQAGLRAPINLDVFAALELLLRRRTHGFLDRFDYQIAINALLLAEGFDVLRNACTHLMNCVLSVSAGCY